MTAHDREEAVKALAEAFLYTEEGGPDNTGYRRGDMVSGFAGDLFRRWAERALTDLDANPTARATLARYLATGEGLREALAEVVRAHDAGDLRVADPSVIDRARAALATPSPGTT